MADKAKAMMGGDAAVTSTPWIVHADAGSIRVRHRAVISPKFQIYLCLAGCSGCACHRAGEALQRTYVEVHENRLEWNYPMPCLFCIIDNPGLVYFDRDIIQHADRAGFCMPILTHMQCWPTCCDICGEGVVLYSDWCCLAAMAAYKSKPRNSWKDYLAIDCARPQGYAGCNLRMCAMLYGLQSANTVAEEINRARTEYMDRVTPQVAAMK